MTEWKKCTIGDILTFQRGHDLPKRLMSGEGYPVVGSNGIIGYHGEYTVKEPAITIGRSGNVGKPHLYYEPIWAHNTTLYVKEFKGSIPEYVYYLLKTLDLGNYAGGSAVPTLNRNHIHALPIVIPDTLTQRRIADFLKCFDQKIDNNTKINRNLSEQAAALYKSWFVDFEPFEGAKPDEWLDGTVDDLASEVVCGKTPSTKKEEYYGNEVPFVTIPDMHGCVYTVHTERMLSELGADSQRKKTLPKNSICVSCIGTAGLVALLPEPSQTNQQINSIVPKTNYSPYYIYLMMNTMAETINKLGQAGSTIVNLNKTQFGKMEVMIPSLSVMADFDEIVEPMFNAILSNQIENIRLSDLRDSLLPKLMSGELDVSDLEI